MWQKRDRILTNPVKIITKVLTLYMEKYYNENDDKQTWFDNIKNLAEEVGFADANNRCKHPVPHPWDPDS